MRDIAQLHAIQSHLGYEVDMLRATALDMGTNQRPGWCAAMSRLEAFAIHARNLLDFYYDDKGIKDDALAVHFFPSVAAWHAVRPAPPDNLADLRDRVNKQIAHLTYRRIGLTVEERRWDFADILAIVEKANRALADHAPAETMTDECRAKLRAPPGCTNFSLVTT